MNYYIDFDNTLYNTSMLANDMFNSIVQSACNQKKLNKLALLDECRKSFNSKATYNIYEIVDLFTDKYLLDKKIILDNLNKVISNGQSYIFSDSIRFLEKIHTNNSLFLLSYSNGNIKYQTAKILGSGIADFFDGLYITSKPKFELDIDYANGIFIDDNPEDLKGLYSKNSKKIIRLRRKENKYSIQDLDFNIEEYSNFDELLQGG